MKVVFCGLGSIGNRLARLVQNNFDYEVFAFRTTQGKQNDLGIPEVYSWDEVIALNPDVAFITNPTDQHISYATKFAENNAHLFIEKPLSHTWQGIEDLMSVCVNKNLTCYTAYCMRFHPVLKKVKELLIDKRVFKARAICASFLPDWRKNKDPKETYSASLEKGGGVLLDLSHELDYLFYLFGNDLTDIHCQAGRVAGITEDSEEFVDATFQLSQDVFVSLHLDYISRKGERTLKVDFQDGYLFADFLNFSIQYQCGADKQEYSFEADIDQMYTDQLQYFFSILGQSEYMNDLNEASTNLQRILQIREIVSSKITQPLVHS